MPIESRCHGCGKLLRVADEHAGKQARCPGCGYVYHVPTPASTPAINTAALSVAAVPQPQLWFMKTPEGQVYGPVAREQLGHWASEGRISGDCFVRAGERGAWQSAGDIFPTLRAPRTRATATSTGGGYAARPPGTYAASNRYVTPHAYGAPRFPTATGYREPHRGALVLTLALLGWFACPIFAVAAWAMGSEDLAKMRRGQMDAAGLGLTQAGQILGMIQSILFLLGLAFILFMCLIGAVAGG
jgi:hypothetical protein